MSRQLFPFFLFGASSGEVSPPADPDKRALTVDARGSTRDLRPINSINKPISVPAPRKTVDDEDPKDSSVTDGATSSPSESKDSPVEPEALLVSVAKESQMQADPNSDESVKAEPTGDTKPPAPESTPGDAETQIYSSHLL